MQKSTLISPDLDYSQAQVIEGVPFQPTPIDHLFSDRTETEMHSKTRNTIATTRPISMINTSGINDAATLPTSGATPRFTDTQFHDSFGPI